MICPGVNLAINIGTDGGTHYEKGDKNPYKELRLHKLVWPLVYNDKIVPEKRQKALDNKDFLRVKMIGLRKRLGL